MGRALGAHHLATRLRERRNGLCSGVLLHPAGHAHADRHLRSHPGDASFVAALGHARTGAHHGFAHRVVLVVAGELPDVARVVGKLLVEPELLLLCFGFGLGDPDLGHASLELRLGHLILQRVDARLIFVRDADLQLADLQNTHPDLAEVRAVARHGDREIGRHAAEVHERRLAALQEPAQRLAETLEQALAQPRCNLLVVSLRGLARVADDEPNGIDDHHRVSAVGPGRHAQVELGIAHRHHLAAEGQIPDRLVFDEEHLGLEDVAAGERSDEMVEERDVLGRERIPPGRQSAHGGRAAAFEEHRAFIEIDGEARVGGDVTVGVLVDDEVLHIVRSCDHHLLHATLDEVDDPHETLPPWVPGLAMFAVPTLLQDNRRPDTQQRRRLSYGPRVTNSP